MIKEVTTLDTYEWLLSSLERTKDLYEKLPEGYLLGYKKALFDFFQETRALNIKSADYPEIERNKAKMEALIKEHNIQIKEDKNFPVCGIMSYRGEYIPVYDDDSGQQEFIIYNDKEICGGSYNLYPQEVFCQEIDEIKDNIDY